MMQKDLFLHIIKALKKSYFNIKAIFLKKDNGYLLTFLQVMITNEKSSLKHKDFGSIIFYEQGYPIDEFDLFFDNIINQKWIFSLFDPSFELFLNDFYCDFRQRINAQSEYDVDFSCFVYRIDGNHKIDINRLLDQAEKDLSSSEENYSNILHASINILEIRYARATPRKIVFIVPVKAKIEAFQKEENLNILVNMDKKSNFYLLSIYAEDESGIRTGFKLNKKISKRKNNILLKKSNLVRLNPDHITKSNKIFLKYDFFLQLDENKWSIDSGIEELRRDFIKQGNILIDNNSTNVLPSVGIDDLIFKNESKVLEKKSSMLSKKDGTRADKFKVYDIIESIASFLNSNNGHLLIGINPENEIVGIEREYEFVNPNSFDGWNLFLENAMMSKFDDTTILKNVNVFCEKKQGHDIAIIEICKHFKPVYIDKEKLYIKTSGGKRRLPSDDIYTYIKNNFDI